jgi:hypothetical protein
MHQEPDLHAEPENEGAVVDYTGVEAASREPEEFAGAADAEQTGRYVDPVADEPEAIAEPEPIEAAAEPEAAVDSVAAATPAHVDAPVGADAPEAVAAPGEPVNEEPASEPPSEHPESGGQADEE